MLLLLPAGSTAGKLAQQAKAGMTRDADTDTMSSQVPRRSPSVAEQDSGEQPPAMEPTKKAAGQFSLQ